MSKHSFNDDILRPAQKQLEAYNNRDIDSFMECYTENCVVEDAQGNVLMEGHEAMRKRYTELFEMSPNLHCELVSRIQIGSYVLDEEHVTGSRGSKDISHVVAVYRVANGLIEHVRFIR
ncbi:nuclear transport factor 2 family protein [Bacillus horti]|uniref:SnoaL-like domain-containing protein n=1 Tax=Caldalkalibacillus horti TaxID=77523 RepID=A0ABT9VY27_9BACI|nr:nuclear transport factor 2 family protein [Bacillus horti]MDQ0165895.1 hypothetical protein [Bacillus horti]